MDKITFTKEELDKFLKQSWDDGPGCIDERIEGEFCFDGYTVGNEGYIILELCDMDVAPMYRTKVKGHFNKNYNPPTINQDVIEFEELPPNIYSLSCEDLTDIYHERGKGSLSKCSLWCDTDNGSFDVEKAACYDFPVYIYWKGELIGEGEGGWCNTNGVSFNYDIDFREPEPPKEIDKEYVRDIINSNRTFEEQYEDLYSVFNNYFNG